MQNQSSTSSQSTKLTTPIQSATSTPSKNKPLNETIPSTPNIEIGFFTAAIGIITFLVGIGVAWGKIKTLIEGIQKSIDNKLEPELKDVRERFGAIENKVDILKNSIDDKIEPELKDVRERFGIVEGKVDTLWKNTVSEANSPRQLNSKGEIILNESGIKEFIDNNKEELLKLVKKQDTKSAYDADSSIALVMMNLLKDFPEMEEEIKTGAFKTGSDIGAVLFVGSIYLRNLIFPDLGFNIKDLDKPKNKDN